jgi:hypothetical protein
MERSSGSARGRVLVTAAFGGLPCEWRGAVNVHRLSHILEYLLAHILHPNVELAANLIASGLRQVSPSR